MSDQLLHEYSAYLDRVNRALGELREGAYAKYRGRLVKRLDAAEFRERLESYQQLKQAYEQSMARGDTINDAMQQMLDERAAELLLESP